MQINTYCLKGYFVSEPELELFKVFFDEEDRKNFVLKNRGTFICTQALTVDLSQDSEFFPNNSFRKEMVQKWHASRVSKATTSPVSPTVVVV